MLFKSKKRKRDLGFFISVLGLSFLIETIIYIFLRAYEYYPNIIPNSPKNDGVAGNIISQFSISTASLLICVFNISFKGTALIVVIFYFIEILFLDLGIYETFWYRPWITSIGLITFFTFVKRWYKAFLIRNSGKMHYLTVIPGVITLFLLTTNWITILTGHVVVKPDILIDPFISHAVVAIPKYLIQINMVYFLRRYNANWLWNAAVIAFILLVDAVLYYTNIVYVKEGWLFIYSGISIFTLYFYVHLMQKLLYSE